MAVESTLEVGGEEVKRSMLKRKIHSGWKDKRPDLCDSLDISKHLKGLH